MMSTPVQSSNVQVHGVDLALVEQGQGDPVVCVHGSLNDYRSWRGQLAPFAESHHVIAYSRRYHWPNAQPTDDTVYAMATHVVDLAALIESLGLTPAHLVGSSYGAMTALTLAVERPALVRSLVLGEPPLLPWLERLPDGPRLIEAFVTTAFAPAGQAFAQGRPAAGVQLFIDGVTGAGSFDHMPPEVRQAMLDNAVELAAETRSTPERYFPQLSSEAVAAVRAPTLLVQGELSPRMFGLITEELARVLPNVQRAMIPAASHGMHAQNPAAYNAAVLPFLRS